MTRLRKGFGKHTKPVEITHYNNHLCAKISLGQRKSTYISLIDIDILKQHSFYAHKRNDGQSVARSSQDGQYLHRILMNPIDSQEIDHVNANPLDNTRGNLRPCSTRQNNLAKEHSNNMGYYGIHVSKEPSKIRHLDSSGAVYKETHTAGIYKALSPKGGLEGRFTKIEDAANYRDELMINAYLFRESADEKFHPFSFIQWNNESDPEVREYIHEMDNWLENERNKAAIQAGDVLLENGW